MPGSTVVINGGWREYYVGDSKMDEFLKWLDENGAERARVEVVGDPEVTAELRGAVVHAVKEQVRSEMDPSPDPPNEPDRERTLFEVLEEKWFKEILPPVGRFADYVQRVEEPSEEGWATHVYHFFTDTYLYHLVATTGVDGHSYLGCQASLRKPHPGEDHTRGSDLPDGPFTKETWDKIVQASVGRELVHLFCMKRPFHRDLEAVEDEKSELKPGESEDELPDQSK